MKKTPWTTGEAKRLVEMRQRGMTRPECAVALGRTLGSVSQFLVRNRLVYEAHDGPWVRERVKALHARGWKDWRIAKEIGRCRSRVTHVRHALGLPRLRSASEDNSRNIRRCIEKVGYHPCVEYHALVSESLEARGWPPGVTPARVAALELFVAAGHAGCRRDDLPGAPSTAKNRVCDLRNCGWVERVGFDPDGFARYRVVAWVAARRAEALKRKAVA